MLGIVAGMTAAVVDAHFVKVERRDALEAGDIDAKLVRVGTTPVVCVNAALGAEVMLGNTSVEAVGGEFVLTFGQLEVGRR